MKCSKCGFQNPVDMHFCGNCGFMLAPSAILFSDRSSLQYESTRIPHDIPHIEEELRQVTIMFCDMKGFTPLSYHLGPEATFALIEKILGVLIHKVYRNHGIVNEIRGDGILAFFSAMDALEDAPLRAIRTSIAIHEEIAGFSDGASVSPIRMRIGINTGMVVIGFLRTELCVQLALVGDTINMDSRMESLAEPGTTYVTEDTYRLTKKFFNFQPLGDITVKGREKPMSIYRVLSVKEDAQHSRPGSERMIASRMVGRDNDLKILEHQVMNAINGKGSVVHVIGEPGIGKSRLIAELRRLEIMKKVRLFEGMAVSIGNNLRFHPIVDLLKQWSGIRHGDGDIQALDKLRTAISRLFHEDTVEVLPFVAVLMGLNLSGIHAQRVKGIEGEALKKLILKSLKDLLVRAAEQAPLILVIDDMHWADASSVELVEALFHLAETSPIIFIFTFRLGYNKIADHMAESVKDTPQIPFTEIVIHPLTEKLSEIIIGNILNISDLHHPLITGVAARTGGNPYFIEEVLRSLIDAHAILQNGDVFHIAQQVAEISIPNTIEALLMARMDRLEEQTRNLLKVASVIGRYFFYRILKDVAGHISNIDQRLVYLQEIQILRKRSLMGELEYLFNHALFQETVYHSMLLQKRKELHLTVARSIERIFSHRLHECYGMLAYHYCMADSLENADACLIKAGEEALKASASNEAIYYFQEALTVYRKVRGDRVDPEKVAMFEKFIGLAYFEQGNHLEAVVHFDRVLNHYWGDLPRNAFRLGIMFIASFTAFILALYFPSFWFQDIPAPHDIETIDIFYKKAEALVVFDPRRFFVESFIYYRKIIHFDLTRFKLGIGIFLGASSLFTFTGISFGIGKKVLDHVKPWLSTEDTRQWIQYDLLDTLLLFLKGQWNEISECNEDWIIKNQKIGEIWYVSQQYYWHGLVKTYQGIFDAAEIFVTKLSEIASYYQNKLSLCLKYLLHIHLLIQRRDREKAMTEVTRGIHLFQKWKFTIPLLHMHCLKASIHLSEKNMAASQKSLAAAGRIMSEVKVVPSQASTFYRNQFEYFLHCLEDSLLTGHEQTSADYRRKALKSGKRLLQTCRKAAQYRTDAYRLMGIYKWLNRDRRGAFTWWYRAIIEGENLGARPQLARTYAEIGKRIGPIRNVHTECDTDNPLDSLKLAKMMFEELGLHHDLEELNSLTG